MEDSQDPAGGMCDELPGTLGAVLYEQPRSVASEAEWVGLVRAIAAGDQLALHGLYERSHRPVYTLAMRLSGNRETAEELTLDVFHEVWRRAAQYDPAAGTVLGWIMNQARSRTIDRLRHDGRSKRVAPQGVAPPTPAAETTSQEAVERSQQGEALRMALARLRPDERAAIEAAFFSELPYTEVALRLGQPLGTIKTRIRSGLRKLRLAMAIPGEPS